MAVDVQSRYSVSRGSLDEASLVLLVPGRPNGTPIGEIPFLINGPDPYGERFRFTVSSDSAFTGPRVLIRLDRHVADPRWGLYRTWEFVSPSDGFQIAVRACETEKYQPFLDWLTEHESSVRGPAQDALARLHELLRQEASVGH